MSKKNPKIIAVGLIFLAVGLAGLASPFISFGLSEDYAILQKIAEQNEAQSFQDQFIVQGQGIVTPIPIETVKPDPNLTNISNRLIIPKIKVDMPIFESDSALALLKGGWIFPGTSHPGQKGNSVIFGHRFRYLPPITNTFYSLDKVGVGDTFTVSWQGKAYTYKVTIKKVIEPTDFSVLNQGSESEMTLITCAPLFSTSKRLVVMGLLIP